jgi:pyruvate dehydrogenase E2 component (dihydrolipoamide acetyltransferase)
MRRAIARRLTESKQTVPHFYLSTDVNVEELLGLRAELNAAYGRKLTITDFLIKALGMALAEVPEANVQFATDQLLKFQRADVAVAVSMPDGLLTPVVIDAANKPVLAIAEEFRALAARARSGKLTEAEFTGGTATLSNLGMYGIRQFEAVINPPQGMILAVGAADKRPCVLGADIIVASVMTVTGSFDHRAIDGAFGAQLIEAFRQLLEDPAALLV